MSNDEVDIPRAPRKPPALKSKQFTVRLTQKEDELLEKITNYLYLTGRIEKKSKNDAIRFALYFLAGAITCAHNQNQEE